MLPTMTTYDPDTDKYGRARRRNPTATGLLGSASGSRVSTPTTSLTRRRCRFCPESRLGFVGALFLLVAAGWLLLHAATTLDVGTCNGACLYIAAKRPAVTAWPSDFPCTSASNATATTSGNATATIPRILHQSWKTRDLPAKFAQWHAAWGEHHPSWDRRVWTDADNRAFVRERYSWFLPTWDALPATIMRVDSVRYLYLHAFGGVYSDLDLEPIRPLDPLLDDVVSGAPGRPRAVLAFMSQDDNAHNVPNAWMASTPGHPFWLLAIAQVVARSAAGAGSGIVEAVTGPRMLTELARMWGGACSSTEWSPAARQVAGDVTVLEAGVIYPYDWTRPGGLQAVCSASSSAFDAAKCKAHFPDAFTITYWSHSWGMNNTVIHKAD
ncbi:hypothetical protein H9P43_009207 [Blastocladiella emersonii ATCC 22665]|nr:hypothetical protein H9P43_009207 [Blastocladiella emersonii ATCC 22665]